MNQISKKVILLGSVFTLYLTVFLLYIIRPLNPFLEELIRFLALFGLLTLFISSIMAAFTREMFQIFGKPFKTVHHIVSLTGLALITLHPIFLAIYNNDAKVFIPVFDNRFWAFAGRPALYLIFIAVIFGFLQRFFPKFWRYLHGLNYVALIFGIIHGFIIGINLGNLNPAMVSMIILRVIYIIMLVLATASFAFKRYKNFKKKQRIKAKQEKKMLQEKNREED